MIKKQKQIRVPFLCALLLAVAIGGYHCYAYFEKKYPFEVTEASIKGPSTIKIDVFSDLHATAISQNGQNMLLKSYDDFLGVFLAHTEKSRSDFVVVNGDLIEGTRQPEELGRAELGLEKNILNGINQEKAFIVGNHDLRSLTRAQWEDAMQIDYLDKAFETGDYKIIVLDSNYGSEGKMNDSGAMDTGLLLSDQQMIWLEDELKNTEKIKIIFMHHPPINGDDVKVGYSPHGTKKIQELFSKYKVAAVFSGHTEKLVHRIISEVNYFVLPGPTKCQEYPGAFASIRMLGDKPIVTLFYADSAGQYTSKKVQ